MNVDSISQSSEAAKFAAALPRFRNLNVWVVGDIMLDEYIEGTVERISPEGPVPIVRVSEVEYRLGGAANVARQVAALGAHASLAGILGRDSHGNQVIDLCKEATVDTRAVLLLDDRYTTRKVRVLARNHQMLRLDWENVSECPAESSCQMIRNLAAGPMPNVIILSDYAKGVLSNKTIDEVLRFAQPLGICVVVDPKRRNFTEYRGARVITPNLRELQTAIDYDIAADDTGAIAIAARALAESAGVEAIVVTLGDRGMVVASMSEPPCTIQAATRQPVSDTTGAGDTVVATLACCLAAGTSLKDAATIANAAAGAAITRVGTVAVDPATIVAVLNGQNAHKVLGRTELSAKANQWRNSGQRIVFTNGCFDLLHAGHLSLLHDASRHGDVLVVAINGDASVRRLKGGGRPIVSEHERAALLAALACVDAVTVFDEDTPLEVLRSLRPDILVKGRDYRLEDVIGRDLVEAYGGQVVLLPLVPAKSTTDLINRIAAAGMPAAT